MANSRLKHQPMVSIIIPCYNSLSLLGSCIYSVLATDYPCYEVIVVDDYSTDGSFEFVKELAESDKHIRVIGNLRRSGPSVTRDLGIKASKGKYVAFLETDMEVEADWLRETVMVLENDASIGAAQSKVLDLKRRNVIEAIGVYIVPQTGWVVNRGFGRRNGQVFDYIEEVTAGAVGIVAKKEVIAKLGGFDPELVHNIDDIDLFWRMWLSGHRVVAVPRSVTYHWTCKPSRIRERATSRLESEFHFGKIPRVFIKNYEAKNLLRYLPQSITIMLLRAFMGVARRDLIPFIGLIKAARWNLKTLPDTLRERYRIQRVIRKVSDDYLMQKIMVKDFREYLRYRLYASHMAKFLSGED